MNMAPGSRHSIFVMNPLSTKAYIQTPRQDSTAVLLVVWRALSYIGMMRNTGGKRETRSRLEDSFPGGHELVCFWMPRGLNTRRFFFLNPKIWFSCSRDIIQWNFALHCTEGFRTFCPLYFAQQIVLAFQTRDISGGAYYCKAMPVSKDGHQQLPSM